MYLWIGIALLATGATLGALFARFGWPFELFASLLPQIGAVALLYALSTYLLGRPSVAACALLAAGLCAYGARPMFEPPGPEIHRPSVRVLWANLHDGRDSFVRAMRLAAREDADVVVFAEFPTRLDDADMRAIAGDYSHHAGRPEIPRAKITIFSRLPLSEVEPFGIAWRPNHQGLAATVQTNAGPLRIVGVHPSVPALPLMQRARDETTAAAFARLRRAGAPAVLVGDFNTVPWSMLFGDLLRDSGVTRASYGPGSTWMSPLPVLGLPIDHAFAAGGVRLHASVGPGIGSDHLPLIVAIELPLSTH